MAALISTSPAVLCCAAPVRAERSLRRTLEAEFGVELASRKPLIRSEARKRSAVHDSAWQQIQQIVVQHSKVQRSAPAGCRHLLV